MTLTIGDQMRPDQIAQHVTTQTYRVLPTTWAGLCKLDPLRPDRAEWQLVRGRWRVWQYLRYGTWIAELPDPNGSPTPLDWEPFDTHAEAIAYADKQARRPL